MQFELVLWHAEKRDVEGMVGLIGDSTTVMVVFFFSGSRIIGFNSLILVSCLASILFDICGLVKILSMCKCSGCCSKL